MIDAIFSWVFDASSPGGRVMTVALPVVALVGLLALGMLAFAVQERIGRTYHDADVEGRGSTPFIGMWLRRCFSWMTQPLVAFLVRMGISPDTITVGSAVLATGAALAVALGHMELGGWLFALSALCDFLDGRVARATKRSSARGALLDSVLDRYVEAVLLIGLAWFYRGSWLLLCVLAALTGSLLVSYVRARGEGLGVRFQNVGIVQRPERAVLLALALVLSPAVEVAIDPTTVHPSHRLVAAALAVLAITTHISAAQRFLYGYRALPPVVPSRTRAPRTPPDSAASWSQRRVARAIPGRNRE